MCLSRIYDQGMSFRIFAHPPESSMESDGLSHGDNLVTFPVQDEYGSFDVFDVSDCIASKFFSGSIPTRASKVGLGILSANSSMFKRWS